jgi:formate hydrogenlyase subunit 6/NADH:ubiquinone oxidoreductase subunit I/coenzyme F420-reducing hydrogenase delta subunit
MRADQCTDCSICATVSPAGAIEALAPTNAELSAEIDSRLKSRPFITFACAKLLEHTQDRASFIEVKCLGRIDESILISAVAAGAETVQLLSGACANCSCTSESMRVAQTVQTANALLGVFGMSSHIIITDELPVSTPSKTDQAAPSRAVSRRAFFDLLVRETVKATAVTVSTLLAEQDTPTATSVPVGKLPTCVPSKYQILLAALRKLPPPVNNEWKGGLWAQFSVTKKCNGCQICAFFCPTGALSKIGQDGKNGMTFKASLCTNCGLCKEICYLNAVTLSSTIDLAQVVNDATVTLLMREADSAFWNSSSEEKLKQVLQSTFTKF